MQLSDTKTNIVVYKEHTFGYIHGNRNTLEVLRASELRGAPFEYLPEPKYVSDEDMKKYVRLATLEDFEVYRIHLGQYLDHSDSDNYHFIKK